MNDPEVRQILVSHYSSDQVALSVHELGLFFGSVRADYARLDPSLFCGYEIKSAVDSLVRLPRQIEGYGDVFDRCCLVVDEDGGHVSKALSMIPEWWGLAVAQHDGKLACERIGGINTEKPLGGPLYLLWKDELLAALRDRGGVKGLSRLDKVGLIGVLADRMKDHQEVRELVVSSFLSREGWRTPQK